MNEVDHSGEVASATRSVGAQLKAAREARGLSIEDVAAQTRIPTRHLASLEDSDWDRLPAPTYTMGFAKSYAGVVGLDRNDIGEQLRYELGSWVSPYAQPEVFEPADPKRAMPRWLVVLGLAAVALIVILASVLNRRSIEGDGETAPATAATDQPVTPAPAPPAVPSASGPVVITATDKAWLRVEDGGATLFEGELAPGQTFEVPATAANPLLTTGKPESIRIAVGTTSVPQVGEAGKRVSGISLKPDALLPQSPAVQSPAATAPQAATTPSSAPRAAQRRPRAATAAPAPVPATPATESPAPAPAPGGVENNSTATP